MPHCPRVLYERVLAVNVLERTLHHCTLVGNSFWAYGWRALLDRQQFRQQTPVLAWLLQLQQQLSGGGGGGGEQQQHPKTPHEPHEPHKPHAPLPSPHDAPLPPPPQHYRFTAHALDLVDKRHDCFTAFNNTACHRFSPTTSGGGGGDNDKDDDDDDAQ